MSSRLKTFFVLHLLLMVYSCSGIMSKLAAGVDMFSLMFFVYYAAMLAILGIYALGWQQILKRLPLTTAYSNRAVTIVWGIIWGFVFFAEPVTLPKIIGAAFIIAGVVLFSYADGQDAISAQDKDISSSQTKGSNSSQAKGAGE